MAFKAAASLSLLFPSAAIAQVIAPEAPDLVVDEKQYGDERKYVVFHQTGVSFEDAQRDIHACSQHAVRSRARTAPSFIPWRRDIKGATITYDFSYFGLAGFVIASIIDGPIERSVRQTVMIRCMTPRGYIRYRSSKDQWQELFEKNDNWVPIAASIASGPTPATPRADP